MLANARGWEILVPGTRHLGLRFMLRMVRIRESVSSMLPVARIGGEVAEAVVLESLIQALSSAAFFVPGALGLDPSMCLAIAGARRLRDLVIFVPGLFAWQFAAGRKDARPNVNGTTT
jgi:hypothetical protein